MEHEKCYIFQSPSTDDVEAPRPVKRRKKNSLPAIAKTGVSIGNDAAELSLQRRLALFQKSWFWRKGRIEDIVSRADQVTLDALLNYVDIVTDAATVDDKSIPSALLMAGTEGVTPFLNRLRGRLDADRRSLFVTLSSGEGSNLKTLLKTMIRKATSGSEELEDDDDDLAVPTQGKGHRRLNYDVQSLIDWSNARSLNRCVIALEDSEGFEGSLLGDLISLLRAYGDRYRFVLVIGVATSIESLEARLPRDAIRALRGQQFDIAQSDTLVEKVMEELIRQELDAPQFWLGANLLSFLIDRHRNHIRNITIFVDEIKYAYMSHFFGNALTTLLDEEPQQPLDALHAEAIRNLDTFQTRAESLLNEGKATLVRSLLESDIKLAEYTYMQLKEGRERLVRMFEAVELLQTLESVLRPTSLTPFSAWYIKAVSGELVDSPFLRELLLLARKMPSDILQIVLQSLLDEGRSTSLPNLAAISSRLDRLLAKIDTSEPLRSQHSTARDTLRTTVISQKISLSRSKATLSKDDATYSEILADLLDPLVSFISVSLFHPRKELFLSEVLIYDLRSSLRDTFVPRPRAAVERALALPHDYLGCTCCAAPSTTAAEKGVLHLAPTHPATAILYHLYLESGALINVADLWTAFHAVLSTNSEGGENDMDTEQDDKEQEKQHMALFQMALAELAMLGMVKPTRRKVDCVAKLAWRGL